MGLRVEPDIRSFVPQTEYDLVVSGSPCTQNSIASGKKRSGLQGKDSSLWWDNLRVIKQSNPQYVIWENPSGVLIPTPGEIISPLGLALASLRSIGYSSAWFTIPGWVLGAPCRRDRTFTIAVKGKNWDISSAIHKTLPISPIGGERVSACRLPGNSPSAIAANYLNDYLNGAYRGGKWAQNPYQGWSIAPPRSIPNRQSAISAIGDSCIPEQAAIAWASIPKIPPSSGEFEPSTQESLPDIIPDGIKRHWQASTAPIALIDWDELLGTLPRFGSFVNRRTLIADRGWKLPPGEYLLPTPLARSKGTETYNGAGGDPLDRVLRGVVKGVMGDSRANRATPPNQFVTEFPFCTHPSIRSWIMGLI